MIIDNSNKLVVGLCGLYSSGKSTVAGIFEKEGFYEINVDKYGHKALIDKKDDIVKIFGETVLNEDKSKVDRKKLGPIVFSDKNALLSLNKVVHGYMKKLIYDDLKNIESKKIIMHAALLFDMNLDEYCDYFVCIITDANIIYGRGKERDNRNIDQIKFILSNQPSTNQLIEYADYIIENNLSKDELFNNTHKTINEILRRYYSE